MGSSVLLFDSSAVRRCKRPMPRRERHPPHTAGQIGNVASANGNLTARRLFDPDFDFLGARIDNAGTAWYLADTVGRVRAMTNGSGTVTGLAKQLQTFLEPEPS